MNTYADFPPLPCFKAVLQHVPRAAVLYASLWKKKGKIGNRCAFSKSKVNKTFLISPTLFRNHLTSLTKLDLLTFEENDELFLIEFDDRHNL